MNPKQFALYLDRQDALKHFRTRFCIPEWKGKPAVYFCGNSLGLRPQTLPEAFMEELNDWAKLGVEGHFHATRPWLHYHKLFAPGLAALVGSKPEEVVAMGSLTSNLHLLFASFYKPTRTRFKILTEARSFSSDLYALQSQCKWHGLNPAKTILELAPRKKEYALRTEDILKAIERNKKSLAVVWMGAVNYYTGQAFDLQAITRQAHKYGIKVGFDLAHAIGNIPLKLRTWDVDFAVWCSYKYLNAGPGAVGGLYVHEKYHSKKDLLKLAGWWGHREEDRFEMKSAFRPYQTAESWQQSNAPVFNMIGLRASLEIFKEAGLKNLVMKSQRMTHFLENLIVRGCNKKGGFKIKIITPGNMNERGCQLSLRVEYRGKELFDKISKAGYVVDWRAPDVIRVAPVPLYNTYLEIYEFARFLSRHCEYEA